MKILHERQHPNGLKILIASKLSETPVELVTVKDPVRQGAQLEFQDVGLTFKIDPNIAVLKLLNSENKFLELIDFEVDLNESLLQYLLSSSKNHEKCLEEKLNCFDKKLTSEYIIENTVSAADVIFFSSLLPLISQSKFCKITEKYPRICNYMSKLQDLPTFKEAIHEYYGQSGATFADWNPKLQPCSQHNTLNLLKGQTVAVAKLVSEIVPIQSQKECSSESEKITLFDIKNSEKLWNAGIQTSSVGTSRTHPILPVEGASNIFITSAIPYVNNVPHLGNIIGCVLSADCFSRFCRLRGDNVLYICGTDEYGTATETKAIAENMTPQQICDKYHKIHADVYKWFNIDFDYFGRTTTLSQTEASQAMFWDLYHNDNISEASVEQLFCSNCSRFLADRFVEGTCPHPGCGYEDARGDQCDGCGKLVNATELIEPRCKLCSKAPERRQSKHLFINLPKIEPELKIWVKETSHNWTSNAKVICESWIRDGLRERCITRDLKWGTPVPLPGYESKVFYVWFDAPIGYISMTMEYMKSHSSEAWEKWWKNPSQVQYYEFMAKDNVPFHSIIFPACQIGTQKPWTKVTHLMATEYLNYEDTKFSKSRGVGVFGDQVTETGICSDVWRFYLLYLRPESQDTVFSWIDLQTKNNSELLNNLGNFVNRSLKFIFTTFKGVIPEATPSQADFRVMAAINQELTNYTSCLSNSRIRDGIRSILSISRIGNQFIQENEPFKLVKADRSEEDKRRGASVIAISANIVALIAILLDPYMPDTSKCILNILNNPKNLTKLPSSFAQYLPTGHRINEPSPLIRKLTDDEIQALKVKFAGAASPSTTATVPASKPKECNVATNPGVKDSAVADRLEKEVAVQGTKVRDLKSQGASKGDLAPEVAILLKLKKELAIAQGIDPATLNSGSKKKGKKK